VKRTCDVLQQEEHRLKGKGRMPVCISQDRNRPPRCCSRSFAFVRGPRQGLICRAPSKARSLLDFLSGCGCATGRSSPRSSGRGHVSPAVAAGAYSSPLTRRSMGALVWRWPFHEMTTAKPACTMQRRVNFEPFFLCPPFPQNFCLKTTSYFSPGSSPFFR